MNKAYSYFILILATLIILPGCKRTKDTFTSRSYHNLVSKFNPLFNGEQALLKAELTLNSQHKDNFEKILPVYKLGDEQLVSNIKPELERAVEKGSKVIQTHSMLIKNSQKNKFIDDCYLLIGKARFYDREYLKALETFNYLILEFPKDESVYEAKLWAAKCKTELNNFLSAKEDFELIYREKKVPKDLKADIFASYAQLEINQRRYRAAYQLLQQAISKTKSKQKEVRWLFICGQLQAQLDNDYEASEIFKKVIKKGPPYELLFQAQLNRARNFDVELHDRSEAFDELEDMLKDDKNFDNRDQIYYAMAEIAEKLDELDQMESFLKKSVQAYTINNKQKALSYLKLAEFNFTNRQYVTAEAYFDSTFKSLDSKDPRYELVQNRKKSLTKLVENIVIVEHEDSLQGLANMSEEARKEKIENYIEELKETDAEKEEQSNAGFNNFATNTNTGAGPNAPGAGQGQWYFYNANVRAVGQRDFTNKFGERKLEDNWRRKNKSKLNDFAAIPNDDSDTANAEGASPGDDAKYDYANFVKDLPLTEEAMELSNQKIIKALQTCGRIYKDELKDSEAAIEALEDLLDRFGEFNDKPRTWYSLYRIFLAKQSKAPAEKYKNLILTEAPESEYASLINNAGKELGPSEASEAEKDYTEAYTLYYDAKYKASLTGTELGIQRHSQSIYIAKFNLLKAFCQARLDKKSEFIGTLKFVVDQFGDTEEAKEAQAILDQIVVDEKSDEDIEEEEDGKTPYELDKKAEHKYVVIVPNAGGKANQLRIKITDFNKKFFKTSRLKTKSVLMGRNYQLITVSNFKSASEAISFYRNIGSQKVLNPFLKGPKFQHFVISSDNFPKFYSNQKIAEYMEYFEKNYLQ